MDEDDKKALNEIKDLMKVSSEAITEILNMLKAIDELDRGNDPNYDDELKKDGFSPFQG